MARRVVITGRGVVSPLGDSPAELFEALVEGRSGVDEIGHIEMQGIRCRLGARINGFKPREYLGRRNLRTLDRTGALVTTAVKMALQEAGWSEEQRAQVEIGLVLGTMYCSVATIAAFDRRAAEAGPVYASPFDFANSVINAAAGQSAIWHGLRGMNSTIACGAASGLRAIASAAEAIRGGRADVVIAGGAEEMCRESLLAFDRSGRLCRTDDADHPCAVPLHRRRNGAVLGEGAAVIVLEAEDVARQRGAQILGEVCGSGTAFDAHQGLDRNRARAAGERSIRQSMVDAAVSAERVAGLSLAADGSPDDVLEAQAMAGALGDRVADIPAFAVAAYLGQCLGAGGGLQAVAAVESLRRGRLPGVRGLDERDPDCPLPAVAPQATDLGDGVLLLNSVSFDGHRCTVVLAPPEVS